MCERLTRLIAPTLAVMGICGCANPFSKYYWSMANRATASETQPTISRSRGDPGQEAKQMRGRGYVLLGYSSFVGEPIAPEAARRQAKTVGADIVVVYARYLGSASGQRLVTLPNPDQQIRMDQSGTLIGPTGDLTQFQGVSHATIPGGYSTYSVPYTRHFVEYLALYYYRPPHQASQDSVRP